MAVPLVDRLDRRLYLPQPDELGRDVLLLETKRLGLRPCLGDLLFGFYLDSLEVALRLERKLLCRLFRLDRLGELLGKLEIDDREVINDDIVGTEPLVQEGLDLRTDLLPLRDQFDGGVLRGDRLHDLLDGRIDDPLLERGAYVLIYPVRFVREDVIIHRDRRADILKVL